MKQQWTNPLYAHIHVLGGAIQQIFQTTITELHNNNKCVVHPKKCNSRETALILKGEKIYSYKNNLPTTKNNEFFISDLIGCNLISKDKSKIGMVLDVKNFGAGDLLEVQSNKKTILIPFNNTNIISVDVDIKQIIADPIKGIIE